MYRRDSHAHFEKQSLFDWLFSPILGWNVFVAGGHIWGISRERMKALEAGQGASPQFLASAGAKRWWAYQGVIYVEDEGLTVDEVEAMAAASERRRRKRIERAKRELKGE